MIPVVVAIALAFVIASSPSEARRARVLPAAAAPPSSTSSSTSTSTTTTVPRAHPDAEIPPIVDGLAPVISRLKTTQPVVFLGIDDGEHKEPFQLEMMKENDIHASLFLTYRFIKDDIDFFKPFMAAGNLIEDHTIDHKLLTNLSYEEQVHEICDQADLLEQEYGRRPTLFRPPGGAFNTNTRRAAATCGMRAVVNWIAKANDHSMQYQIGHGLRPGDIVLMHFRPEFRDDMQAFIDAMHAAGLHTEHLEDWIGSAPIQPRDESSTSSTATSSSTSSTSSTSTSSSSTTVA